MNEEFQPVRDWKQPTRQDLLDRIRSLYTLNVCLAILCGSLVFTVVVLLWFIARRFQ